jgi:vancomycin resistance protein YoaR
VLVVGLAFAGSPSKLAAGTSINGVDVAGLTLPQARALLVRREAAFAKVSRAFSAGGRTWKLRADGLDVRANWSAALAKAHADGGGDSFALARGFQRLALRLSPVNIQPPVTAYRAAIAYEVGKFASSVDQPAREPRLVVHGLQVETVHGETGLLLDRAASVPLIEHSLADFSRTPVALPVRIARPTLSEGDLGPTRALAETALSAPVAVAFGRSRWKLSRAQLASMLVFQQNGKPGLSLGGPSAAAFFRQVQRTVGRKPQNAHFVTSGSDVTLAPAEPGVALDLAKTAAAILAAAEQSGSRVAQLVVAEAQPSRSTAQARALGITGLVSSYETFYGGIANRIHNVELVAQLINGKLIAPGATFSFNQATGARTAQKGFVVAPVIINGELQTGLGGGVCQVSTTVFNAAYEAGLPITDRTNHALYISHYPLGRDATVDYPDVDLKFVNDTPHWLLLRTSVGPSSLIVYLYGTPQHRRVVTDTAPLVVVKQAPVQKTVDPALAPGQVVVDMPGEPAMSTSVRRRVYSPDGKLLSDVTWYSNYVASPVIERVGPKAKPKPKPKKVVVVTPPTQTTTTAAKPLQ